MLLRRLLIRFFYLALGSGLLPTVIGGVAPPCCFCSSPTAAIVVAGREGIPLADDAVDAADVLAAMFVELELRRGARILGKKGDGRGGGG